MITWKCSNSRGDKKCWTLCIWKWSYQEVPTGRREIMRKRRVDDMWRNYKKVVSISRVGEEWGSGGRVRSLILPCLQHLSGTMAEAIRNAALVMEQTVGFGRDQCAAGI